MYSQVAALLKLQMLDSDRHNIVRWNKSFVGRRHICLEFEQQDKTLFDFTKREKVQTSPSDGDPTDGPAGGFSTSA